MLMTSILAARSAGVCHVHNYFENARSLGAGSQIQMLRTHPWSWTSAINSLSPDPLHADSVLHVPQNLENPNDAELISGMVLKKYSRPKRHMQKEDAESNNRVSRAKCKYTTDLGSIR